MTICACYKNSFKCCRRVLAFQLSKMPCCVRLYCNKEHLQEVENARKLSGFTTGGLSSSAQLQGAVVFKVPVQILSLVVLRMKCRKITALCQFG
jgi:hypothetical protein